MQHVDSSWQPLVFSKKKKTLRQESRLSRRSLREQPSLTTASANAFSELPGDAVTLVTVASAGTVATSASVTCVVTVASVATVVTVATGVTVESVASMASNVVARLASNQLKSFHKSTETCTNCHVCHTITCHRCHNYHIPQLPH